MVSAAAKGKSYEELIVDIFEPEWSGSMENK